MKICCRCNQLKDINRFRSPQGIVCVDCRLAYQRAAYHRNKAHIQAKTKLKRSNPEVKRKYKEHCFIRDYDLTLLEYQEIFDLQGGYCSICLKRDPKLYVDHNHKTKKVRALICQHCNSMLGFSRDSIPILKKAIQYLEFYDRQK